MTVKLEAPTGRAYDMFAHRHPTLGFIHVYASEVALIVCGDAPAIPVRVTIDPAGTYWGWWEAKDDRVSLVWPNETLFRICFAYGFEAEEERGRGRAVRLRVEEIAR